LKGISYAGIAEAIADDVRAGKYGVGVRCPSLTQIAKRFGVSRVTAVRAVDELKRRGIVESRSGCGVFVTRQARMLGGALGFIVPGLCYADIFPPICRKISQLAQEKGLSLLFGDISSESPDERAEQAVRMAQKFADERVLGVFFQPVEFVRDAERINREILSTFDAAKIPVVLIDSDIVPSPARSAYDLVGINNFDAGRLLAQHLADQGARNVGFIHKRHCDFSVLNRCEGVRSVLLARGGRLTELAVDAADVKGIRAALARRPRLDAIVCRNDHQAAHLLVTLRKLGRNAPADILVAGFNDVDYAAILEPGLTTVHLPCADIAQQAFGLLLERISNPGLPVRECYLPAPLVVRGSTCRSKSRKGK